MNDVEKAHRRMDMRRNETKNAATRQKLAEIEKLEADARDWELADASVAATTLGAEANAAREKKQPKRWTCDEMKARNTKNGRVHTPCCS